eukprot:4864213-Lingulodinium_polyedra.AAC.1
MAKRAVIDLVNRRLHLCGPGHLLLPESNFHAIKPASDKLAPRQSVVAPTSTETSADPKGGGTVGCQPSPIRVED